MCEVGSPLATQMSKSSSDWPPSLRRWLEKSLGGLTVKQTQQAQEELKKVVKSIMELNAVWKVDWDTQATHRLGNPNATIAAFSSHLRKPEVPPPVPLVVESKPSRFTSSPPTGFYQQQQHPQQPNSLVIPTPNQYAPPPSQYLAASQYGQPISHYVQPTTQYAQPTLQYAPPTSHYAPPATFSQPPQYQPAFSQPPPPKQYQQPAYTGFAQPAHSQPSAPTSSYQGAPKVSQWQPTTSEKRARKVSVSSGSDMEEDDRSVAGSLSHCAAALQEYLSTNLMKSITPKQLGDFYSASDASGVIRKALQSKGALKAMCAMPDSGLKFTKNTISLVGSKKHTQEVNDFTLKQDAEVIAARASRFSQLAVPTASAHRSMTPLATDDIIVGTCEVVEKSYLRSSSEAPNPSLVRPESVLGVALERVKAKLVAEGKSAYPWANDQMKAIRQDLKFQHLHNNFATSVYETHARLAIEYGGPDLSELNTCVTQLREIGEVQPEFRAYLLLYHVYCALRYRASASIIALSQIEARASKEEIHVRSVFLSVHARDWATFFVLYSQCPNLGKTVLRSVLDFVRLTLLRTLCCCAPKQIPVARLSAALACKEGEFAELFSRHDVLVSGEEDQVDVKATLERVNEVLGEGAVWE